MKLYTSLSIEKKKEPNMCFNLTRKYSYNAIPVRVAKSMTTFGVASLRELECTLPGLITLRVAKASVSAKSIRLVIKMNQ